MSLFGSLIVMLVLLLLSDLQGRQYILQVLEEAVLRSKERIRGGAEPSCLLDFWTQQILTECQVRLDCDYVLIAHLLPFDYSAVVRSAGLLDLRTQQILTECQVPNVLCNVTVKTLCTCSAAGLMNAADPQCVTGSEVRACKCTTHE
jgi:hypothetical protein